MKHLVFATCCRFTRLDQRCACAEHTRKDRSAADHTGTRRGARCPEPCCSRKAERIARPTGHRGESTRGRQHHCPGDRSEGTPDGHTLLHCGISNAIAPRYTRGSIRFSPGLLAGFPRRHGAQHPRRAPIDSGQIRSGAHRLRQNESRKMDYASIGVGTSLHLSMELFKSITATDLVHVPYKGGSIAHGGPGCRARVYHDQRRPGQVDNIRTVSCAPGRHRP